MIGGIGMPELIVFVVGICFLIGFIFIIRELVCWYLKQNEIVSLLKDIKILLEEKKSQQNNSSTLGDNR